MAESFSPKIIVDGKLYAPNGFEWVLGFALAGCDWAIKKADTPEFRQRLREHLEQENKDKVERQIADYEQKITDLRHLIT